MTEALIRPVTISDAALVHAVYCQTPKYFEIISIPMPTLSEVQRELEVALQDPRRCVELLLDSSLVPHEAPLHDPESGRHVVGYLDYKIDYPERGDATVNLLLIPESLQSQGHGRKCIQDLEARLTGRVCRVLASIYGQNPRAERFWRSLGYRFAIDAKPILDWYAKELSSSIELGSTSGAGTADGNFGQRTE